MTEQELIDSVTALTSDSRTVLKGVSEYALVNKDLTFNLSGGVSVTFPSLPKQVEAYATQQKKDRLDYLKNFGGVPKAQVITYNGINVATALSTFDSGWQQKQTFNYSADGGTIVSILVEYLNSVGVVEWSDTKTLQYSNGLYTGVI